MAACRMSLLVWLCAITARAQDAEYGVDVSFPMHYATVSNNYAWLPHNQDPSLPTPPEYQGMAIQPLGDRRAFYEDMMNGCRTYYGAKGHHCDSYERDRVAMGLRQPQSMQNYTDNGFKKIKTPDAIWRLIKEFWDANKDKQDKENWPAGNTYTNHWRAETRIANVENKKLRGGGFGLKNAIWEAAQSTIEDWTGEELTQCSLYGIRIYTEGSVLSSHVDRLPLVSSAIINVDSDVDEPWPLEVIGHDGKAYNVTMEPGDMVLYESHSVLHGRPYPLRGRFVANLFVHFEPIGHSLRHDANHKAGNPDTLYRDATARGLAGHEADQEGLPPYLIPGTPEVAYWKQYHSDEKRSKKDTSTTGSTSAHLYAQEGNLDGLKRVIKNRGDTVIHAKDSNGWTPLHEGVRAGHVDVVKYLHSQGADVNARVKDGLGGSPLYYAHKLHGADHPVSLFLESVGGVNIEPEL